MGGEIFPVEVNVLVRLMEIDFPICLEVISENFCRFVIFKKDDVGPVAVHLEQQGQVAFERNRETPFIFILPDAGDFFHDHGRKKIQAVFSGAPEVVGERETTETRLQRRPYKKGLPRIIELNHQLILILRKTGDDGKTLYRIIQFFAELT